MRRFPRSLWLFALFLPVALLGREKPDRDGQPRQSSSSSSRTSDDGRSRNQQDPEQARREVQNGKKDLDRQRYDKALEHFDTALKTIPRDLEARILAARAARMLSDFETAKKHLDACANFSDPDGRLEVARSLLAAQTDAEFVKWERLLSKKVDDKDPDREAILEVLTLESLRMDRLPQTIEYADKLLAIRANHLAALLWRGQALEACRDSDGAVAAFKKALDVDADFDLVRAELVQVYLSNNNPGDALKHAEIVHKHRPNDSQAVYTLAVCNRKLGRSEKAVSLLDDALRTWPREKALVIERALVSYQLDPSAEESVQWLQTAYKLAPKNREVLYSFSRCLRRRGADNEATAAAAAGATVGAVGLQGYIESTEYGAIDRTMAKMEQQFFEYQQVERKIYKDAKNIPLRIEAAKLAEELDMNREALLWLKQALTLAPDDHKVHQALADFYENQGDVLLYRYHRARANPPKP